MLFLVSIVSRFEKHCTAFVEWFNFLFNRAPLTIREKQPEDTDEKTNAVADLPASSKIVTSCNHDVATKSSTDIDYDTYLMNRRPGSTPADKTFAPTYQSIEVFFSHQDDSQHICSFICPNVILEVQMNINVLFCRLNCPGLMGDRKILIGLCFRQELCAAFSKTTQTDRQQ